MNQEIHDPTLNKSILINKCTQNTVANFHEMKLIYDVEYLAYTPDFVVLKQLSGLIQNKKIIIILGTWCGDSKTQIPRFIKLMDLLLVDEPQITIFCVDGNKKADDGMIELLEISNIPTFIIFDNKQQELGRIIETPIETLEKDLLLILKNQ